MPTPLARSRHLYQFYIGGTAGRANIELHDVQFAAVSRVQDAYPALREAWFGDPGSLHLDGYMRIDWADGFDLHLAPEPDPSGLTLFFVNMGGYRADSLAELHKDDLREVDNCLALGEFGGLHVHLQPNPSGTQPHPDWQGYRPIARRTNIR